MIQDITYGASVLLLSRIFGVAQHGASQVCFARAVVHVSEGVWLHDVRGVGGGANPNEGNRPHHGDSSIGFEGVAT